MKYLLKFCLLLFIVFCSVAVFAQETQIVPGTNFKIIPPSGFVLASNFSGFQENESGSSIMVVNMFAPIEELMRSFKSKEVLASQGMDLINHEDVIVDNMEGILIKVNQSAQGQTFTKLLLLFGSDDISYLVNGVFLKNMPELETEIRKSLLSVKIDDEQEVDISDGLHFEIDHEKYEFNLVQNLSGSGLYSRDGEFPPKTVDKAGLIVGSSFYKVEIKDEKLFAINRLKLLPEGEAYVVDSMSDIEIDGIKGKAIIAYKWNNDIKVDMIYQVILYSDNLYYSLVGICISEFETNLNVFKNVLSTFRIK